MKAKKAFKRLTKVETLLSDVVQEYSSAEQSLKNLLENAKASVTLAKESIDLKVDPAAPKKPPAKADTPRNGRNRLSAAGRKKISEAAKKRWASAKRKGLHAVTGRRLSKSA